MALLIAVALLVAWVRTLPGTLAALDEDAEGIVRRDILSVVGPGGSMAAKVDAWITVHPADYQARKAAALSTLRDPLMYEDSHGVSRVYPGDFDSWVWLRNARNYLRHGTTCDEVRDGQCRDSLMLAPLGGPMRYGWSPHLVAIVALHRVLSFFDRDWPLPATAFWTQVLLGTLIVGPAWLLGRRLGGGIAGGLATAILTALNPILLERSLGNDNDAWNVLLPVLIVWAACTALGDSTDGPTRRSRWLVAWSAIAGAALAIYAATWRGWIFLAGVVTAGSALQAIVLTLRGTKACGLARSAMLVAGLTGCIAIACMLVTEVDLASLLDRPWQMAGTAAPSAAGDASVEWPDVLAFVGELTPPGVGVIVNLCGGPMVFLLALAGLLLVCLPRRAWEGLHAAVFLAGLLVCVVALWSVDERNLLVAALSLPLLVALLLRAAIDDPDRQPGDPAAGILVIWFLGALFLSFSGRRLVLLLGPPVAAAVAVAVGRLAEVVTNVLRHWKLPRPRRWAGVTAALLVALVCAGSVRQSHRFARAYVPRMNDAWWNTLTQIRNESPSDSIVTTWWDYGHFVKFVAERATSVDGGSLTTHVPHWIGRALLADSIDETLGLLRMLNCGSDALPEAEGASGAFARLIAAGLDEAGAHRALLQLARMDRPRAAQWLEAEGVSHAAIDGILAATHCIPPASYLVLSSDLATLPAWQQIGAWTPAGNSRDKAGYLIPHWIDCRRTNAAGGDLECPIGLPVGSKDVVLDTLVVGLRPEDSRFAWHRESPPSGELASRNAVAAPGSILYRLADVITEIRPPNPLFKHLSVLVDRDNARVLVGPPRLLHSTFTRLMFLPELVDPRLQLFADQHGARDERVLAWRLNLTPIAAP